MAEETKSTSTTKATEEKTAETKSTTTAAKTAETKPATTTATKSSTTKTDEKKTEAKAEDAREAAQKKLAEERGRVLQNPSVLSGQIGVVDTTGTGGLTDSEALVEAGAVFKDPVYEATLEAAELLPNLDTTIIEIPVDKLAAVTEVVTKTD